MSASDVEQRCAELAEVYAQVQDKTSSVSERRAACAKLSSAIRTVARTKMAGTAVLKLLELGWIEWLLLAPLREVYAYIASGELQGYENATEMFSFVHTRFGLLFAVSDGWGSHDHPDWHHRVNDSILSTPPKFVADFAEMCGDRAETAAGLCRAKEWGQAANADFRENDDVLVWSGACLSVAVMIIVMPRVPVARGECVDAFVGDGASLQATSLRLRELPLDSAELYLVTVYMMHLAPQCMASADHVARLFASGMLEGCVELVQRARHSQVPPHVNVNRGVGQLATAVATTTEGRTRLLATTGVEEALQWLLEHGGDPVGLPENRLLADPRGPAGVALALLRGREEDVQIALPAQVIGQICWMIDTYFSIGAATVLPYAQGLEALSVSDVNKRHLTTIPTVVDSLRRNLLIDSQNVDDATAQSLRTVTCSTLAQLGASDVTLPLLLGHVVLQDLEKVPSLPGTSKDAQNDALAVLFAVQQHEKRAAGGAAQSARSPKKDDTSWIMMSYEWGVQPTIVRIRDSLQKRNYRVWMDIDQMRGSDCYGLSIALGPHLRAFTGAKTMDAMSEAIDNAAVVCYGVSAAYKESANCRLEAQYAHQTEVEMVPMMMERDYKARGWLGDAPNAIQLTILHRAQLGMILGTRLWYGFFAAEQDDDAALESRVEAMCREIGPRGKIDDSTPLVPEGVPKELPTTYSASPPAPAPTPAPAPIPISLSAQMLVASSEPTPASVSGPAMAPAPPKSNSAQTATPTKKMSTEARPSLVTTSRSEIAAVMREMTEAVAPRSVFTDDQVQALQTSFYKTQCYPDGMMDQERLWTMQKAQLLSDDEMHALEDVLGDYLMVKPAGGVVTVELLLSCHPAAKVYSLLTLSEGFSTNDTAFARQARRRFVHQAK